MAKEIGHHQRRSATYVIQHSSAMEGFDNDGNLHFVGERKQRRELPLRQVTLFLLAVVSFRVILFLDMGAASYGAKIEALAGGDILERVAARVMGLDPVSSWLAKEIQFRVM